MTPDRIAVAAVLALSLGLPAPARSQISLTFSHPGISIGLNVPVYPELVQVPGYPVYYDPNASSNYFFYDGLYWVFQEDAWYSSTWYDGPWQAVGPEYVPLFVLRVPVRYYHRPPSYFRGWEADAAPRWGQHWGRSWESRRSGWDRWDRRAAPAPAPLPAYQRQYAGERYPRAPEQQHQVRSQNYRHEPRDDVTRQLAQPPRQAPPAQRERGRDQRPMTQPTPREQPQPRDQRPMAQPTPREQPQPRDQRPMAQPTPREQPQPRDQRPMAQPTPQERDRGPQPERGARGREGREGQGEQREKDRSSSHE
jgi:hypothetical protein